MRMTTGLKMICRNISAIAIVSIYLFICSCSPLRNHYLNKYCKNDTTAKIVYIHDTIVIDSIRVDSVFSDKIDSVYLVKDKIEIQYVKKFGKVYLQGKCKGDTIYYEKKILVYNDCKSKELAYMDKFMIKYKWAFVVIALLLVAVIIQSFKK
jgi:hypothetical protein